MSAAIYADDEVVTRASALSMLALGRQVRLQLDIYDWECVDKLRAAGVTWREIGQALGMPKQNAQRKFGDNATRPSWEGTHKPNDDKEHPHP